MWNPMVEFDPPSQTCWLLRYAALDMEAEQ